MTCPTGKRGFPTRADARRMRRRYPAVTRRAYLCADCGQWHLGRLSLAAKHGDPARAS